MPLKLKSSLHDSIPARLDAFRKKIKDGQGYLIEELQNHPAIKSCNSQISSILRKNKWGIKRFNPDTNRMVVLLVNPRTLAKETKEKKNADGS